MQFTKSIKVSIYTYIEQLSKRTGIPFDRLEERCEKLGKYTNYYFRYSFNYSTQKDEAFAFFDVYQKHFYSKTLLGCYKDIFTYEICVARLVYKSADYMIVEILDIK